MALPVPMCQKPQYPHGYARIFSPLLFETDLAAPIAAGPSAYCTLPIQAFLASFFLCLVASSFLMFLILSWVGLKGNCLHYSIQPCILRVRFFLQ